MKASRRAAAIKNGPDLAPAVERGHVTVAAAYRVRDEPAEVKHRAVETVEAGQAPTLAGAVKRIKQEEAREQAVAEATNTPAVPSLRAAPIGELELAMPPTARGSVEGGVYCDLGRFAAHALRPGRVVLTRAASAHLPEVLQQLAVEGLEYRWSFGERPGTQPHTPSDGPRPHLRNARPCAINSDPSGDIHPTCPVCHGSVDLDAKRNRT